MTLVRHMPVICGMAVLLQGLSSAQAAEGLAPVIWSLPDAADVERALHDSPLLQIAQESIAQGRAREKQLQAGPHEPQVAALVQRRTNEFGRTSSEQEFGLQSGVRWPWKRALDVKIGGLAHDVGELGYLDAWHEAARVLLDRWYAWVHAELSVRLDGQQLEVLQQQQAAVTRRVAAGDAARVEQLLAEAEVSRAMAGRSQAQRDAHIAREAMLKEFPILPARLPAETRPALEFSEGDAQLYREMIEDNHEIELAEARRDEALLSAERARQERLADPSIGLRYSTNIGGDRKVVGLTFSMPIGGAARTAEAELARSDARRAAGEAQRARDAVAANARSVLMDARQSLRSWKDAQAASLQLAEAAATTARGYALGESDISTLLAARRAALTAERETLDALMRAEWSHARVLLDAHRLWVAPDHESRSTEHEHDR